MIAQAGRSETDPVTSARSSTIGAAKNGSHYAEVAWPTTVDWERKFIQRRYNDVRSRSSEGLWRPLSPDDRSFAVASNREVRDDDRDEGNGWSQKTKWKVMNGLPTKRTILSPPQRVEQPQWGDDDLLRVEQERFEQSRKRRPPRGTLREGCYRCTICGVVFESKRRIDFAAVECDEHFGPTEDRDKDVVCDACWKKILEWKYGRREQ